jgi:hypothetical protein
VSPSKAISSAGVSLTLPKAGLTEDNQNYGLENSRQGRLSFTNRVTWTTGAPNAPYTLVFP